MSYTKVLEEKIDQVVQNWNLTTKKGMFGGLCYFIQGHVCFGIYQDFLVIRPGEEIAEKMLKESHVKPFDAIGVPMKGWIMIEEELWKTEAKLLEYLETGKTYTLTLPPK